MLFVDFECLECLYKETEGVLRLAASWLMASCCLLESKRDLRQDKQKRVG
jgi:hypothetical protein